MMKKLLSLALALAMVLCLLPAVQLTADAAELPKLAAPTDVALGYCLEWEFDETTQEGEEVKSPMPGSMVFKAIYPHQNQFKYELYRVGEEEPVRSGGYNMGAGSGEEPRWEEHRYLCEVFEDLGSGTYYITLVAEGDGINYADSDPAKSPEWTYVKPEAKLDKCTDLAWNGTQISWTYPEDHCGFDVEVLFAATEDAEPTGSHYISSYYEKGEATGTVDLSELPWIFQQYGVGYYYFRVRAISSDISKWCNSEWSEICGSYYLDTAPVNNQLQDIIEADKTGDELLEAVQEMDNQALKQAMLADQQTADNIAMLEEKVGGAAAVEVSKEAAAFAGQDISIVGANLNKTSADAEDVKLVIDKPEKDHVLGTQYNNSVAVKFSMDLENVANTENLAVPVKVTLPVPASINPQFLVVLHYHADGSMEEVWPYIETKEDGKTYASFVLTSFSDFTMTEFKGAQFADVAQDAYYFEPVQWAVAAGVTNGMTDTTFAPEATCTRAQIVTFLWRANGSPASGGTNPFTDVPADAWYTDAVLWAVEKGITTGTSATTFSPDAGCTRGQVATFLWRSQGQPSVNGENIFTDIAPGAYYYDAVLWAVANGITNGMGEGLFAPDATCTRGQIVTFLYRAMAD